MPKSGIYQDYDLQANQEIKDRVTCIVCGKELACRWTDYHGEGVCLTCETPYQLIQYDENGKRIFPAPLKCNVKESYIPLLKQYWQEVNRPMGLGRYLGKNPSAENRKAFNEWLSRQLHEDLREDPRARSTESEGFKCG